MPFMCTHAAASSRPWRANLRSVLDYLVVAGGAGGTGGAGGVGASGASSGAGGVRYQEQIPLPVGAYPVIVGAKGTGAAFGSGNGTKGGDSEITGLSHCTGGGGGGTVGGGGGVNGGSGGGTVGGGPPGSGIAGEGNSGLGANGGGATGGPGVGTGLVNSISGTAVEYGQAGQKAATTPGSAGVSTNGAGTNGRDGIVIIRYRTGVMVGTGGTITTIGALTIHTFTANGTFTRVR